jgi:hypothetical protein
MQDQPKQVRGTADRRVERVVVLLLLCDDHAERWSRSEIEHELRHHSRSAVNQALDRLAQAAVLHLSDTTAWASKAVRRLDELDLISI